MSNDRVDGGSMGVGIPRRTVVGAVAWAVPAIVLSSALPAAAASLRPALLTFETVTDPVEGTTKIIVRNTGEVEFNDQLNLFSEEFGAPVGAAPFEIHGIASAPATVGGQPRSVVTIPAGGLVVPPGGQIEVPAVWYSNTVTGQPVQSHDLSVVVGPLASGTPVAAHGAVTLQAPNYGVPGLLTYGTVPGANGASKELVLVNLTGADVSTTLWPLWEPDVFPHSVNIVRIDGRWGAQVYTNSDFWITTYSAPPGDPTRVAIPLTVVIPSGGTLRIPITQPPYPGVDLDLILHGNANYGPWAPADLLTAHGHDSFTGQH